MEKRKGSEKEVKNGEKEGNRKLRMETRKGSEREVKNGDEKGK